MQQLSYGYDPLGNMTWREDRSGGGFLRETFGYDNLQRLTSTIGQRANGVQEVTFAAGYDGLGNNTAYGMGQRGSRCTASNEVVPGPGAVSSIGINEFCYDARGNQVRTLDPNNAPGTQKRTISYSSYDLARDIRSNNPFSAHVSQFVYGPERSMVLRRDYTNATASGTPQLTYYAGDAEIIVKSGAPKEIRRTIANVLLTQIVDASGNLVGLTQDVLLTDVLGSTHRITDTAGTPRSPSGVQQFTAFGSRASTVNGAPLDGATRFNWDDSRTREGFTGHQQIDANGLIHMGARLYDPVLGRFVQADSMIPDGTDLQQFNRYTYVSNNPLTYTDPTGHWGAQQQGYLRLAGAIAVAVATAGTAGPVVGQMTATQMGVYMASGFASGALATGNLRGAVTGSFTSLALAGLAGKFIGQEKTLDAVLANAAAGGVVEQINGGKFGHGFVSAGFTAALVPHISTSNDFADGVLHAIVGGTASELAGGKFANGALTAAFGYAVKGAVRLATSRNDSGSEGGNGSSLLSDSEWEAEALGTGPTGAQLKEAISVEKWALNKYGSKCTETECGGYVYLLKGKFVATAAVPGERHKVSLLPAQDLVPEGATIVLDYHLHDRPPPGMRSDFFSPHDITAINTFANNHPGFVGGVVGAQGSAFFYKSGWLPNNASISAIRNVQFSLGGISK